MEENIFIYTWYSDSLEIDLASVDLPSFIKELSERISTWESGPINIVPAPKSQYWHINDQNKWVLRNNISTKLRPLAHVCIEDQVISTARLLCLANQMEQLQESPLESIENPEKRRRIMAHFQNEWVSPFIR